MKLAQYRGLTNIILKNRLGMLAFIIAQLFLSVDGIGCDSSGSPSTRATSTIMPSTPNPSGTQLWKHSVDEAVHSSGPTVAIDNHVFVPLNDGFTQVLDALTGSEQQRLQMNHAPILAGGIYYYARGAELHAIDSATQLELWDYKTGGVIFSSPLAIDTNVYFGSDDGYFYDLDASSGKLRWKLLATAPTEHAFSSAVLSLNELVFTAYRYLPVSSDTVQTVGQLFVVDAATGQVKWHSDAALDVGDPVATSDSVYLRAASGGQSTEYATYAFDSITGKERWKSSIVTSKPYSLRLLGLLNGMVYIAYEDVGIVALDTLRGNEKWRFVASGPFTSLVTAGNTLYAASGSCLFALDATTGTQKWCFSTERTIRYPPSFENGILYFTDDTPAVYAVH